MRFLMLATAMAFATPALAGDDAVDAWKEEAKTAKKTWKSVDKLAGKWKKAAEKDKDLTEIDEELLGYYKADLAWLRDHGVKTVEEAPAPEHPTLGDKTPLAEDEKPKMEALRDLIVELKTLEPGKKETKKGKLLDDYVQILEERYVRKDKKFHEVKDAS